MDIIIKATPLLFLISELLLLIFKRSKPAESKTNQDKQSIKILWIVIILAVCAGIYSAGQFPMAKYIPALQWGGIALLVLGLIIRWIAIYQLGKAFTVDVSVSSSQKIKDNGLYKKIRHPSYLGLLLEFLGMSLLFNSWYPPLIINIPIIFALAYRLRVEEALLSEFFGENYEHYKKHTKRIIPYIW